MTRTNKMLLTVAAMSGVNVPSVTGTWASSEDAVIRSSAANAAQRANRVGRRARASLVVLIV